jgi:hypothetical protein
MIATQIGLFLLFIDFIFFFKKRKLIKRGIKTEATVTNIFKNEIDDTDLGKRTIYIPVFKFYDDSYQEVIKQSDSGSSALEYKIGEKVVIIYEPYDRNKLFLPEKFKGDYTVQILFFSIKINKLYRNTIILFIIAAAFIIIGEIYLLVKG